MPVDPNSHEALKSQLSEQTLRDIEGLDPAAMGFCREECCGAVPEKIRGSMKLKEHVFLCTKMPATEWAHRSDNIPGFKAMNEHMRTSAADATFTAAQTILPDEEESVLRFKTNATGNVTITQYSPNPDGELPWDKKGTLAVDRSEDTFLFICAHHTRDARCGYCGTVLVDLFRQALAKEFGPEKTARVSVHPCAHVGGHIYAGNVLVYNKFGGVCYGLFKPTDIPTVVAGLSAQPGVIPAPLVSRVRGQMGSLRVIKTRALPVKLTSPAALTAFAVVGAALIGVAIYGARSKS